MKQRTFRGVYKNRYGSRYDGVIRCLNMRLDSLKGAPMYVGAYFSCTSNNLKSLEGAPVYVANGFYCQNNDLKSLKGSPIYVGDFFSCEDNKDLKSLEGLPRYIGYGLYCDKKLLHGENSYIIISSLIRGRYHKHIKEGEEFKDHILKQLEKYFTA